MRDDYNLLNGILVSSARAVRSLATPGMPGIFLLSVLATLGALAGFVGIAIVAIDAGAAHLQGHETLRQLLPWLGGFAAFLLAFMLFPGIMPVIVSFFDDRIARTIEIHEYPGAQEARIPEFWPEFFHDVRFFALTVALNILVLPLYLLPFINLFLFYGLNGSLLGREFFVMVAKRHMPINEANALRKRYGRPVMMLGILLTLLATVPFLNLFAPFWGIAVMVHLYHTVNKTPVSEVLPPVVIKESV